MAAVSDQRTKPIRQVSLKWPITQETITQWRSNHQSTTTAYKQISRLCHVLCLAYHTSPYFSDDGEQTSLNSILSISLTITIATGPR